MTTASGKAGDRVLAPLKQSPTLPSADRGERVRAAQTKVRDLTKTFVAGRVSAALGDWCSLIADDKSPFGKVAVISAMGTHTTRSQLDHGAILRFPREGFEALLGPELRGELKELGMSAFASQAMHQDSLTVLTEQFATDFAEFGVSDDGYYALISGAAFEQLPGAQALEHRPLATVTSDNKVYPE